MKSIIRRLKSDLAKQQPGLKDLGLAISAAALLMPAATVYSGDTGDSALESIGLLTFETGATDRFALYDDGVFGDPTSTNPPTAGGDAADATQTVVEESNNKCELDQDPSVVGPDPLVILAQQGGQNVGFAGDSMGIFSRGGGGNARGVKCGRVDGAERLIFGLGPNFDLDGDTDLDVAVIRTRLDVEFKQNAIAIFTTKFAGALTGQFFVRTGTNSGSSVAGLDPAAIEILCDDLSGSDSQNDSGSNDNCAVEFEGLWDSLEIEAAAGQISLEGGGDHLLPFDNRSEFELVRVDGVLDCQGTFSSSDGTIDGARLNNVGGDCGDLVPFSLSFDGIDAEYELLFDTGGQDVTMVLDVEYQTEDTEFPISATKVSWAEGDVDWGSCSDSTDPNCFELEECVGVPLRFCGADPLSLSCVTDEDCSGADEGHQSCELTDIVPPAPVPPAIVGVFPDLDTGRVGPQYACVCDETVTYLGTVGRDGIAEEGGYPNGDDTENDQNLVEQCVFIEGDIKWNR